MIVVFLIVLYFLAVFVHFFFFYYPKKKMEIAEEIVKSVDSYNLEVLKKFSEQKLDPVGYNREIKNYKGEFGKRVLSLYRKHHLKPVKKVVNLFKSFYINNSKQKQKQKQKQEK
jgi:hypothetical protein